jgi:glycosyltransferase involved in cell wall biosynthesis
MRCVIFPYNKTYTGGTGPLTKGACSYGKPVIITNVSGMYELVKKHRFGLIAEAENPRSIAEKIIEFIALDEEQKRQLISNSLSFGKLCSWDNLAKKFITIAEKVYQDEREDPEL